ncbi:ABC transporter permease [Alkalilimnicola ehrlichii]|uniref:ABC transporter permease n=1 Tax=Alkalilimnicola ehrlichii TaxID=351052 RepID=UPI00216342E0|nr:ABC transporter permease [Alkalilimnicola ehrlichii]
MSTELMIAILASTAAAATPLVYAALGELVTERAGVLNLGLEGMMLVGAIVGFAGAVTTGNLMLGFIAGITGGMAMALIFAVLTISLQTNQVATGLALTLFGLGLSAFIGRAYIGVSLDGLKPLAIPLVSDIPLLGPLLATFDLLIYGSFVLLAAVYWFLTRTRPGLMLRAVGEAPAAAHAIGRSVLGVRYLAVLFGGAMSGLGGAYLALAITPMWVEGMTAGRGWIALALVVFATWKPMRVLLGAYLFGGVTILQFHSQALGIKVPAEFLSMLPYLATIICWC